MHVSILWNFICSMILLGRKLAVKTGSRRNSTLCKYASPAYTCVFRTKSSIENIFLELWMSKNVTLRRIFDILNNFRVQHLNIFMWLNFGLRQNYCMEYEMHGNKRFQMNSSVMSKFLHECRNYKFKPSVQ